MHEGPTADAPQDTPPPAAESPSKRSLLKAAWVAPVVLSLTLPQTVMAQASPAPGPSPNPAPTGP